MNCRVLVTYATKYVAAAEIGEMIGQVLRQFTIGGHHT